MIRYIVGTKEKGNLFKDNRSYKSKTSALKARSRAYLTVNESLDILEIEIESDKEKILRLEKELQKTREQLDKAEKVVGFYAKKINWKETEIDNYEYGTAIIVHSDYTIENGSWTGGKQARQYFQDKDKQGE